MWHVGVGLCAPVLCACAQDQDPGHGGGGVLYGTGTRVPSRAVLTLSAAAGYDALSITETLARDAQTHGTHDGHACMHALTQRTHEVPQLPTPATTTLHNCPPAFLSAFSPPQAARPSAGPSCAPEAWPCPSRYAKGRESARSAQPDGSSRPPWRAGRRTWPAGCTVARAPPPAPPAPDAALPLPTLPRSPGGRAPPLQSPTAQPHAEPPDAPRPAGWPGPCSGGKRRGTAGHTAPPRPARRTPPRTIRSLTRMLPSLSPPRPWLRPPQQPPRRHPPHARACAACRRSRR
eukprot:scaffold15149_cov106-Isochrysis_galbana.AAC.5